jgi:hypothetical protein
MGIKLFTRLSMTFQNRRKDGISFKNNWVSYLRNNTFTTVAEIFCI